MFVFVNNNRYEVETCSYRRESLFLHHMKQQRALRFLLRRALLYKTIIIYGIERFIQATTANSCGMEGVKRAAALPSDGDDNGRN